MENSSHRDTTQHRNNFYVASDEIKNHIKTTYRDTGKMTFRNSVFSGDNLQRVRTLIFSDKESWEEFDNDDVISDIRGRRYSFVADGNWLSHNTSNNIENEINFNGEE